MRIKDILSVKGSRIETVPPQLQIDAALRHLDDRNISALVVINGERQPIGLLYDRLVMRLLARRGAAALNLTVGDVMQTPAPMCALDLSAQDAMRRMTDDRVRHLVVMQDDRLAGIVSIGDLVKSRLIDADLESRVLRELALSKLAAE